MKKENKLTLWTTGGREEHLRQRKENRGKAPELGMLKDLK